jgi:hypothetical protein
MPESSLVALQAFLEAAPAARRACRHLRSAAQVALRLAGGPARFTVEGGRPALRPGPTADPDFTLEIPPAAVSRLTGRRDADVGELGILFFQLLLERDPALRIRARLHASTGRLAARGYLGVLASGGLQVAGWLLRRGIADPRRAIELLRGG